MSKGCLAAHMTYGQVKIPISLPLSTNESAAQRVWQRFVYLYGGKFADKRVIQRGKIHYAIIFRSSSELPNMLLRYAGD